MNYSNGKTTIKFDDISYDPKTFVDNGLLEEITEKGSLPWIMFSSLSNMSTGQLCQLKQSKSVVPLEKGVIAYEGVHVFAKCGHCEICHKFQSRKYIFKKN